MAGTRTRLSISTDSSRSDRQTAMPTSLAQALALTGRYAAAADDYESATKQRGRSVPHSWLAVAVLRLRSGDLDGYRRIVADRLHENGDTTDTNIANFVAWIGALATVARPELEICLRLSEHVVVADPAHNNLNTLGGLLYRDGRFDEAIAALERGMKAARPIKSELASDLVSDWAFLAMAHVRLGNRKEGERCLDKAILQAHRSRSNYAWIKTLESDLLVGEANALVMGGWSYYLPADVFQGRHSDNHFPSLGK